MILCHRKGENLCWHGWWSCHKSGSERTLVGSCFDYQCRRERDCETKWRVRWHKLWLCHKREGRLTQVMVVSQKGGYEADTWLWHKVGGEGGGLTQVCVTGGRVDWHRLWLCHKREKLTDPVGQHWHGVMIVSCAATLRKGKIVPQAGRDLWAGTRYDWPMSREGMIVTQEGSRDRHTLIDPWVGRVWLCGPQEGRDWHTLWLTHQ